MTFRSLISPATAARPARTAGPAGAAEPPPGPPPAVPDAPERAPASAAAERAAEASPPDGAAPDASAARLGRLLAAKNRRGR
ncbi:hypothetical protein DLM86_14285 [Paenibacillus flagellatus]|uniref:Uncharacterized protein n=1 Tax=Paenibacillus flagellatus TaxID=2211139 RepID=A0A2V5K5F8_9BACL|nr:hypothetical protein DLM86_14285 [Paenibacillus flagellatus]